MTPEEAEKRVQKLLQMINTDFPTFIKERTAHNAVTFIEQRVQNTGKNYLGNSFRPYSTKPILTSGTTAKSKAIWNQLASSKASRRDLDWVTIKRRGKNVHLFELKGGYKQLRQLEGLQTAHKDFWFTTQMWRGFGVKRILKNKGSMVITIGGKDPESQNKIDRNSKREGVNIINISDQELEKLAKQIDQQIQKYINKVGLS